MERRIRRGMRKAGERQYGTALRYGVDKSLINRVKAGIAWRDYSNPFNQLMGLAA